MADERKKRVDLSTMDGQREAWEDTYQAIAEGTVDTAKATNLIKSLRGTYILCFEGPLRAVGLLARLGKDNDTMRGHASRLTEKLMKTMSPQIEHKPEE
jgi:hypothetical protein